MRSFRVLPVPGRRAMVAVGLAVAVAATTGSGLVHGQQADPFKFSIDTPIIILSAVKPATAADFEAGWAMIREEIAKSARPEVQAFGATLTKFYKADTSLIGQPAAAEAPVNFILYLDPPSKTQSYSPTAIIYTLLHMNGAEGGITRARADEIWNKLKPAYDTVQLVIWPLAKAAS